MATQEYRQDFVQRAYLDLLHRAVDPGSLAFWVAELNAGATDQLVFAGICSSQEYYDKTLP